MMQEGYLQLDIQALILNSLQDKTASDDVLHAAEQAAAKQQMCTSLAPKFNCHRPTVSTIQTVQGCLFTQGVDNTMCWP